jgi:hypothetical protein
MAFITMCLGTNCVKKDLCMHYTWKSHASEQHYFDFHPLYADPVTGELKCREFHPNDGNNKMYRRKPMP